MTELEFQLYNKIIQIIKRVYTKNITEIKSIFEINPNEGTILTSAKIYIKDESKIHNIQDLFSDKEWFGVLGDITDPLLNIYNSQNKFVYLTMNIKPGTKTIMKYEPESEYNQYRFVLWEYDEFGIGDRNIPIYKRILDKYRPLK